MLPAGRARRESHRSRTAATGRAEIARDATPEAGTEGLIRSEAPETLKRIFEDRYVPLRLVSGPGKTLEAYRTAIEGLSVFRGHDVTAGELSDDLAERFLASLIERGKSVPTANKYRRCPLAIWRYAWRKRLCSEAPRDVSRFREAKRLPKAWSTEEVTRILEAARATEEVYCGVPSRVWWPALLLTLYDTGLRIDAVLRRATADLSPDGWLSVPAEDQKQNADQAFKLHPETLAAIAAMEPERRELLFPWPYRDVLYSRKQYAVSREAVPRHPRRGRTFGRIERSVPQAPSDARHVFG